MSAGFPFPFLYLMAATVPMLFAVVGIVFSIVGARRWENAGWWVIFAAQVLRLCMSPASLLFRHMGTGHVRAIASVSGAVSQLAGITFLIGLGMLAFGSTRRRMEGVGIPADSGLRPPAPRRES